MRKLSILFTAFVLLLLVSCGKYEDGPGFSLLSKTARMTNKWELKSVDGQTNTGGEVVWDLKKGGDASFSFGGATETGSWEFSSDKEDLILEADGDASTWKIRRLTNKELWLELEEGIFKFEAQ